MNAAHTGQVCIAAEEYLKEIDFRASSKKPAFCPEGKLLLSFLKAVHYTLL